MHAKDIGFLTLTRRPGESIAIGEDITITFQEMTRHGQVRVDIRAPKEVLVLRSELLQRSERRR